MTRRSSHHDKCQGKDSLDGMEADKQEKKFKTYLLPEHRDSAANFCTIFPYIPLNVASTASQNSLIWEGTLWGIKGAHIDMCSAVTNSTESLVKSAILPRQSTSKGDVILLRQLSHSFGIKVPNLQTYS